MTRNETPEREEEGEAQGEKNTVPVLWSYIFFARLQAHLCITMHNQATGKPVSAEGDLSPLLIFNRFLRVRLKKWPRATPKGQKKPCIITMQESVCFIHE